MNHENIIKTNKFNLNEIIKLYYFLNKLFNTTTKIL